MVALRPSIGLFACCLLAASCDPSVNTPLGVALGKYEAGGLVERYGSLPYSLPPLGPRRFARAEVHHQSWAGGSFDARRLSAPCIQNPLGDPRSDESESAAPTEDCLTLNIWRPAVPKRELPIMAYLFGGGLCGGWAGNQYFNGSALALEHKVLVTTWNYRLGALGFMVGDDAARPGSGGMNGIHDNIIALQWLKSYGAHFGGNPGDITLFGQSSGGYSICTLSVAPAASGLFRRAIIQSGPCIGGPPGRTWGPMSAEKGRNVSAELLVALGKTTLDELRDVPAEKIQWPDRWMNSLDLAPYFSGYFEDPSVVPGSTDELWVSGKLNPAELIIMFTSKDGTGAFYGNGPTLGLVGTDEDTNNLEAYVTSVRQVWGPAAEQVLRQYPMQAYTSAPSAWVQADADAYVICPLRRMARYASHAGRRVFVGEFAHFQPAKQIPKGCSGWGPLGCEGFGCDNGVELDVVPGHQDETTRLWASHGAEVRYIFGTEVGEDGLGPPNNQTYCFFEDNEWALSAALRTYWSTFARLGDPNAAGLPHWPAASPSHIQRMRFSLDNDGSVSGLVDGVNDQNCDFWDSLYPRSPTLLL